MLEGNKNAAIGQGVEHLFANSLGDRPLIIAAIKDKYNIKGDYRASLPSGVHGEKCDVKVGFSCGRNIDANIKAFKAGFNQLTRTSVSNFCKTFDLEDRQLELEQIITAKASCTTNALFSEEAILEWKPIIEERVEKIIKWSFSANSSREILVLFDREKEMMYLYAMKDILKKLTKQVTFTKGGFNIGECVSFQRKGGNGSMSKTIPKTSIKHPGNNIQLKLKVHKFITVMEKYLLAKYNTI